MNGTVLSFYLNGRYLGVDITRVKEINRNIEYTIVPGSPPEVAGLLNLRGQVISLLDLGCLLEGIEGKLPSSKETGLAKACIILKIRTNESDTIGFLIDKPGEVLEIKDDICEPLPANLSGIDKGFMQEVARMKEALLIILDVQKIQM